MIQQRLAATSDQFFKRFVQVWLGLGAMVWLLEAIFTPTIQYPGQAMVIVGAFSFGLVHWGHPTWGRWAFLLPLCGVIIVMPWFVNGVRTPLLLNMPMLVVLTGWLLGRRAAAGITAIFILTVIVYWALEAAGRYTPPQPLRSPLVWVTALPPTLMMTGITIWAMLSNYAAQLRKEMLLQQGLDTALAQTRRAQEALASVMHFNEAILLNSPLPMGVYSADGQCVQVNEACAVFAGTTREHLLQQNFHQLESFKQSGVLDSCLQSLADGQARQHEGHAISSAGKELFCEYRVLPTLLNGQKHLLIQYIDLSERKRLENELRQLAFHDALTRLPNRRLLLDRLRHALQARKRLPLQLAVLLLDLNRFKLLNDTHGHEAGDLLLVEVARRLQGLVRASDTVARLGGDEFVVLLQIPGTDPAQAQAYAQTVADKIEARLSEDYVLGEIRHQGSASVGIKLVGPQDEDADQIIKDADTAMYAVKRGS